MRKALAVVLAISLLGSMLVKTSLAAGTEDVQISELAATTQSGGEEEKNMVGTGNCGGQLTWTLDSEGTLTISGMGEMDNYGYDPTQTPP